MAEESANSKRLRSTRHLAWLALLWESAWPLLLPFLCVLALFLSVSWLGLWPLMNEPLRWSAIVLFALTAVASLYPLSRLRLPRSSQTDSRIEKQSGKLHRPVTAQDDEISGVSGSRDPMAAALWREHKKRASADLGNLRAGVPVPKVAGRDPYGMRAAIVLVLFIGLVGGWGNLSSRIAEAFIPPQAIAAIDGRIDAWVKPPAYTNRPPLFISRAEFEDGRTISVPEGSEIFVRTLDLDQPSLALVQGGLEREIEAGNGEANSDTEDAETTGAREFKAKLAEDATVVLRSGADETRSWNFAVIPDADPTIAFVEQPKSSLRGALEFSFSVKDDYGVVDATAKINTRGQLDAKSDPLVPAPEVALPLPQRRAKDGTSKTTRDLSAHPWAGAEVTMTLTAKDEAGQEGHSEAVTFTLPERVFVKPLALAIVEERRRLALDTRNRKAVAEMLDVITSTHPEEFIPDKSVYTGLRVAYRIVVRAQTKDELRSALDLLWDIALAVEDGGLSIAEKRLRDAQERLSDALENGASDEEIAKLMDELRQAMDEFMRELAEQMQKNPNQQQAMPLDPNAQVLRQQDLERMMQQIEDLAKSGSKDAARQMLQEMQRMLNNLQMAQPSQRQQQQNDEFSKQMDQLGEMMREQQKLMDETFDMQRRQQEQQNGQQNGEQQQGQQGQQPNRQGQRQQPGQQGQQGQQNGGQKPMTPQEFADAMKELQRQQGELQQQMQKLQDAMRGMGMDPGKLGEAGEAMGQAEGKLGQGETEGATGQQGRALQAMRDGAQQMMQQLQNMARQQGQQRGDGQGTERGGPNGEPRGDRDPLGRQSRTRGPQLGDDTKVPGAIDAQRAREILDAIRRRLSEPSRPRLELDYLDRLLPTR